jgi:tRNA dimethylallyltransferase
MNKTTFNLIVVLGPTASGKTALGVALAERLEGEIISADSRQVFRGMDIGTGKDLPDYGEIPYHLIDLLDSGQEFSVFAFQHHAYLAIEEIRSRKKLPIVVGGTGLYLDALLKGYRMVEAPVNHPLRSTLANLDMAALRLRLSALRPEQHNRTDLDDRERLLRAIEIAEAERAGGDLPDPPDIRPLVFGIRWPRELLRKRIRLRLRQRLEQGMIAEVETLLAQGVSHAALDYYGLEYRFVSNYLQGNVSLNDMEQKLYSAICQFAKRQETWFRRMERQGTSIIWLPGESGGLAMAMAQIETSGMFPG